MKRILFVLSVFSLALIFAGCKKTKNENDEIMQGFEKAPEQKNMLLEKPAGAETFSEGAGVAPRTLCEAYLMRGWEIAGARENISDAVNAESPVNMFIRFEDEGVYRMGFLDKPYDDIAGFYEMGGNTVKLKPPVGRNFPLYDLMFPAGTEQVLIYDFDYPDFYDCGVLYNDNIVLRSHFNTRVQGETEKLILDGVEVYAEDGRHKKISENMRLRSRPSVSEGKLKYADYAFSLYDTLKHPPYQFVSEEDSELYAVSVNPENTKCQVLLKGQEVRVLARTVTEETIDGATGPWYCIAFEEDPSCPYYLWPKYWVFGGGCEFSEWGDSKLEFLGEARARGMVVPREDADNILTEEEEQNLMVSLAALEPAFENQWGDYSGEIKSSADMAYNMYLYFKKGNYYHGSEWCHVTNEYLNRMDIKVKLGMTKAQVMEAWGEPHGTYGNSWVYAMDYEGHGFEVHLTWDYNKLKKLYYEHWK